jgi:hypothetical protein
LLVIALGALHGASMGSFALRADQALVSAVKLPLLIGVSTATCLPSFYALNVVLGLREDFSAALRGVLATRAIVAAVLASLAPVIALIYVSGVSYRGAVLWNGGLYCIASLAGQKFLARHYRPLVARNRRHLAAWVAWLALYWFVTIQMAWVLRPFVSAPGMRTTWLRPEAWSNAYVTLAKALLGV